MHEILFIRLVKDNKGFFKGFVFFLQQISLFYDRIQILPGISVKVTTATDENVIFLID